MSNIWRPINFDSLSSQVIEQLSIVEISLEDENEENQQDKMDSFGLAAGGK